MAKKKRFTYNATCVFQMQFTFDESQVESEEEAGNEPDPTTEAMTNLETELREYIGQNYAVGSLEVCDDGFGCVLLSISEEDD